MKKPFYKHWWFYVICVVFVLAAIFGNLEDNKPTVAQAPETTVKNEIPQDLKGFVEYTLSKEFPKETNNDKPTIRDITINDGNVIINLNGNDNFTNKTIVGGMEIDCQKVLKALSGREDIKRFTINEYMALTDTYGNETDSIVFTLEISKEKVNKIVWDGFTTDNFKVIADKYEIHKALAP